MSVLGFLTHVYCSPDDSFECASRRHGGGLNEGTAIGGWWKRLSASSEAMVIAGAALVAVLALCCIFGTMRGRTDRAPLAQSGPSLPAGLPGGGGTASAKESGRSDDEHVPYDRLEDAIAE